MRIFSLIIALFAASAGLAADFSGQEIFIPVISRVPGANSSQWRTDVVIASRGEFAPVTVKLVFEPATGVPIQSSVTLSALGSVTLTDVVLSRFGKENAYGTLWVGSQNETVDITAHARIYNTGNAAGEFGQMMQGLPINQLSKRIWISGVNGINGNRTNIGIANPNNVQARYTLSWYDRSGNVQGTLGVPTKRTVEPWDVELLNEIFSHLHSAPDDSISLLIVSDVPLYAYASVVRNDTGDAYTIVGNGSDD